MGVTKKYGFANNKDKIVPPNSRVVLIHEQIFVTLHIGWNGLLLLFPNSPVFSVWNFW